jgi:hypothetical protein
LVLVSLSGARLYHQNDDQKRRDTLIVTQGASFIHVKAGTLSLHDLWTANYGGVLFYSIGLGLFWIGGACVHSVRVYRRALLTDPVIYAEGKPPTLRRILQTLCWLTFGIALFTNIAFESLFAGHRPPHSIPSEGRIYPLNVHGYVVYLSSREHVLVSNYWMLVAGICLLFAFTIARDGDPFASKLSNVPEGALPRSFIKPAPSGWLSGKQILLIIGGYLAALLLLIATLIGRAFAAV